MRIENLKRTFNTLPPGTIAVYTPLGEGNLHRNAIVSVVPADADRVARSMATANPGQIVVSHLKDAAGSLIAIRTGEANDHLMAAIIQSRSGKPAIQSRDIGNRDIVLMQIPIFDRV